MTENRRRISEKELMQLLEAGKPQFPWGEVLFGVVGIIITLFVLSLLL